MPDRIYKEALGIKVGDVVTTDYSSGPFYVWDIHGPVRFRKGLNIVVYPWPVVSLKLVPTEDHHLYRRRRCGTGGFFYVNDVLQQGDKWFQVSGSEVFVCPPRLGYPHLQMDLLLSFPGDPVPYQFQDGVDYAQGHRQVWHCDRCSLDFNSEFRRHGGSCLRCGRWVSTKVIMVTFGRSVYLAEIN